MTKGQQLIKQFLHDEHLPEHYRQIIHEYWLPLAEGLVERQQGGLVVGINGAQGSGKSTMAAALALLLRHQFDQRVVILSIDDLYHTRAYRQQLAAEVHSLLQTRGVPGTHDVAMGLSLIHRLRSAVAGDAIAIPTFAKAIDDRLPESQWPVHHGSVDIILFEGWCVATPPQDEIELSEAVNALEADEDADGSWRRYINQMLEGSYHQLFSQLDLLLMLRSPDFESICRWRSEQEQKLRYRQPDAPQLMDELALTRFIRHYERLTRHNLAVLPGLADITYCLDRHHQIVAVEGEL